jgi:hypothetical protein
MNKMSKERFWKKVERNGPSDCWIYTGVVNANGYGVICIDWKNHSAHRAAWFYTYGEWPKFLLHSCDNRRCVNPAHLREGNHQQNAQDRVDRGRSAQGSSHGRARLAESDISQIDILYWQEKRTEQSIADLYGVSRGTISHAIFRRNWKHVERKVPIDPERSRGSVRLI